VLDAAARLGLGKCLEVCGPVDKASVPAELDRADVFINTTRYESFGVAVLEAAAAGLPIVTMSVGEIPFLWEDGVDALLVAEREPAALAAAVRRVLVEPGLADRLSRNARARAEQFDWSRVVPRWESLLSALAEGKSP